MVDLVGVDGGARAIDILLEKVFKLLVKILMHVFNCGKRPFVDDLVLGLQEIKLVVGLD